jgi:large subunit ribosomal protein L10
MDNPRPEKVAVVDEVRSRLDSSSAAILTEYRGLTVAQLAELRSALEKAGGEYKVYKNTLVKLATTGGRHEVIQPLLEGPTAIAFVSGEISAVAKTLRDYSRTNPHLIVKGGFFGDALLSSSELTTLADLPPRDVLLARLAGGIAAPLQQLAGLLQALPRNLAYGLSALIEKLPAAPAAEAPEPTAPEPVSAAESEAPEGATAEAEVAPEGATAEAEVATEGATAEAEATAEPAEVAETQEATEASDTQETKEQGDNG